jgi:hypothetical protein
MTAYRPHKVATSGKLVPAGLPDPGRIDSGRLAHYWRKESPSAAKRMASRFGIRCIAGQYPWLAIWSAEGLATPAASSWTVLQQSHLTTDDVAALLACEARTIRRYVLNPPDGFPAPVFASGKPWLWRSGQIHAYVSGRSVPQFRRAKPSNTTDVSARDRRHKACTAQAATNNFNPFSSQ